MRLNGLVLIANRAYPDPEGWIFANWDPKCEEPRPQITGDTLAAFIVREIHGSYDSEESDKQQLATAANAIDRAMKELRKVRDAFSSAYVDAALDEWAKKQERGAA